MSLIVSLFVVVVVICYWEKISKKLKRCGFECPLKNWKKVWDKWCEKKECKCQRKKKREDDDDEKSDEKSECTQKESVCSEKSDDCSDDHSEEEKVKKAFRVDFKWNQTKKKEKDEKCHSKHQYHKTRSCKDE